MAITKNNRSSRLTNRSFEDSIPHYLLLMLACMNFLGYGGWIFVLWGAYACFRFLLANQAKFEKSVPVFFLLALSTLVPYCVNIPYFNMTATLQSINFVVPYFIGCCGYMIADNKEKYIKRTVLAIFAGFAIYLVLTLFFNIQNDTFARSNMDFEYSLIATDDRTIYDFWRSGEIAATLVGLLGSVVIGYSFYVLFFVKNPLLKLLMAVMLAVVFYVNFATATRTPIVLFFLMLFLMSFVYVLNSSKKQALYLVAVIFGVAILLLLMYQYDIFGFQTYLDEVPLLDRFRSEGLQTPRIQIMKLHYDKMFDHLWGGRYIQNDLHVMAHNFLQEAHDMYGIFATVLLIIVTISMIVNVVRLFFAKNKQPVDYLFLSMYLSILVQCCVEPVFQGYPILFWSLILVHGLATAYLKDRNNLIKTETETGDDNENEVESDETCTDQSVS